MQSGEEAGLLCRRSGWAECVRLGRTDYISPVPFTCSGDCGGDGDARRVVSLRLPPFSQGGVIHSWRA